MLGWAWTFLVVALIAALLGFGASPARRRHRENHRLVEIVCS